MPDLGSAVGLQFQVPNVIPQMEQIAAEKQARLEKYKLGQAAQKKKMQDSEIAMDLKDINVDEKLVDPILSGKANQLAQQAYSNLWDSFKNDPSNIGINGSREVAEFKNKMGILIKASEEYKKLRDTPYDKLGQAGLQTKVALGQAGTDYDKFLESMTGINDPTQQVSLDPNSGAFQLNYTYGGTDFNKLGEEGASKLNQLNQQKFGQPQYLGNKTIQKYADTPLDTEQEAQSFANQNKLPFIPGSIESQAKEIANSNPQYYADYINRVAVNNPDFYTNGQFDMKKAAEGYLPYIKGHIQSNAKVNITKEEGTTPQWMAEAAGGGGNGTIPLQPSKLTFKTGPTTSYQQDTEGSFQLPSVSVEGTNTQAFDETGATSHVTFGKDSKTGNTHIVTVYQSGQGQYKIASEDDKKQYKKNTFQTMVTEVQEPEYKTEYTRDTDPASPTYNQLVSSQKITRYKTYYVPTNKVSGAFAKPGTKEYNIIQNGLKKQQDNIDVNNAYSNLQSDAAGFRVNATGAAVKETSASENAGSAPDVVSEQ